MHKRLLSATVVGASALTLGAGLFAWQATSVTINGVESAGAADQTLGCLIGDLSLAHNDPIYDTALNEWFITGINVTGDAGSDATACEGYTLKVSYETLAGATIQVGTVEDLPDDAAFAQALAVVDGELPGVPTEDIKNWQVVIADASGVVIETLTLAYSATSFAAGSDGATISPAVTGGLGLKTFTIDTGTLPAGVTFDETTGVFTGPAASAWNFEITQISSGTAHTCVVTTTGGAKCWGDNGSGKLGNGTTTASSIPVNVTGLTTGVTSISTGDQHTCAVVSGGAKCWGNNGTAQLGDNTFVGKTSPVDVTGLTTGVTSITSGANHACVRTTANAAKCWGEGEFGALGDNATITRKVPVQVVGLTTGVTSLSAGQFHTCAVVSGGAKCWGDDSLQQLGEGSDSTQRNAPVNVAGLTTGVAMISGGLEHTCAVTTTGGAKCWGNGNLGRLGNNSSAIASAPVNVTGLTTGVATIAAGHRHTCAVTTTGGAKCWGQNTSGHLGDGSTTQRNTPVDVTGLTLGVSSISAGAVHTCAIVSGGGKCWGFGTSGQLGNGALLTSSTSVNVSKTGPQSGFPSAVTVKVTDDSGFITTPVELSLS